MRAVIILGFMILMIGAAVAQSKFLFLVKPPPPTPIVGALLLEDNISILLLEDNTSNLCLEGGC